MSVSGCCVSGTSGFCSGLCDVYSATIKFGIQYSKLIRIVAKFLYKLDDTQKMEVWNKCFIFPERLEIVSIC